MIESRQSYCKESRVQFFWPTLLGYYTGDCCNASRSAFLYRGALNTLIVLYCIVLYAIMVADNADKCLVLDTVPVSVTLSQLACQSYNNTKDFYLRAMAKQDLPKRYHYSNNRRIDDIVLDIADHYTVEK